MSLVITQRSAGQGSELALFLAGKQVSASGLTLSDLEYMSLQSWEIEALQSAIDSGYATVTANDELDAVASASIGSIIARGGSFTPGVDGNWDGDSVGVPNDIAEALDELASRVSALE
jgi:hypothetical protein